MEPAGIRNSLKLELFGRHSQVLSNFFIIGTSFGNVGNLPIAALNEAFYLDGAQCGSRKFRDICSYSIRLFPFDWPERFLRLKYD